MNVLAIVGSPRNNGNTAILTAKIADGARAAGADVHTIHLGGCVVRECDGCHTCWRDRSCAKDDDMRPIYPKIAEADLLVLATPVYWYAPTALLKAFIDRFVYFNCPEHRAQIQGKKVLVAVVLEEDQEATWQPVVRFFDQCLTYLEMQRLGQIVVGGVGPAGAIRHKSDRLTEAFELGRAAVQTA